MADPKGIQPLTIKTELDDFAKFDRFTPVPPGDPVEYGIPPIRLEDFSSTPAPKDVPGRGVIAGFLSTHLELRGHDRDFLATLDDTRLKRLWDQEVTDRPIGEAFYRAPASFSRGGAQGFTLGFSDIAEDLIDPNTTMAPKGVFEEIARGAGEMGGMALLLFVTGGAAAMAPRVAAGKSAQFGFNILRSKPELIVNTAVRTAVGMSILNLAQEPAEIVKDIIEGQSGKDILGETAQRTLGAMATQMEFFPTTKALPPNAGLMDKFTAIQTDLGGVITSAIFGGAIGGLSAALIKTPRGETAVTRSPLRTPRSKQLVTEARSIADAWARDLSKQMAAEVDGVAGSKVDLLPAKRAPNLYTTAQHAIIDDFALQGLEVAARQATTPAQIARIQELMAAGYARVRVNTGAPLLPPPKSAVLQKPDGNDLIVFQGRSVAFETFDPSLQGSELLFGPGAGGYYTDSPRIASSYTKHTRVITAQEALSRAEYDYKIANEALASVIERGLRERFEYWRNKLGDAEVALNIARNNLESGPQLAPNVRMARIQTTPERVFNGESQTLPREKWDRALARAVETHDLPAPVVTKLLSAVQTAGKDLGWNDVKALLTDALFEANRGVETSDVESVLDAIENFGDTAAGLVNAALIESGFDVLEYDGGTRVGGLGEHRAFVVLNPDVLASPYDTSHAEPAPSQSNPATATHEGGNLFERAEAEAADPTLAERLVARGKRLKPESRKVLAGIALDKLISKQPSPSLRSQLLATRAELGVSGQPPQFGPIEPTGPRIHNRPDFADISGGINASKLTGSGTPVRPPLMLTMDYKMALPPFWPGDGTVSGLIDRIVSSVEQIRGSGGRAKAEQVIVNVLREGVSVSRRAEARAAENMNKILTLPGPFGIGRIPLPKSAQTTVGIMAESALSLADMFDDLVGLGIVSAAELPNLTLRSPLDLADVKPTGSEITERRPRVEISPLHGVDQVKSFMKLRGNMTRAKAQELDYLKQVSIMVRRLFDAEVEIARRAGVHVYDEGLDKWVPIVSQPVMNKVLLTDVIKDFANNRGDFWDRGRDWLVASGMPAAEAEATMRHDANPDIIDARGRAMPHSPGQLMPNPLSRRTRRRKYPIDFYVTNPRDLLVRLTGQLRREAVYTKAFGNPNVRDATIEKAFTEVEEAIMASGKGTAHTADAARSETNQLRQIMKTHFGKSDMARHERELLSVARQATAMMLVFPNPGIWLLQMLQFSLGGLNNLGALDTMLGALESFGKHARKNAGLADATINNTALILAQHQGGPTLTGPQGMVSRVLGTPFRKFDNMSRAALASGGLNHIKAAIDLLFNQPGTLAPSWRFGLAKVTRLVGAGTLQQARDSLQRIWGADYNLMTARLQNRYNKTGVAYLSPTEALDVMRRAADRWALFPDDLGLPGYMHSEAWKMYNNLRSFAIKQGYEVFYRDFARGSVTDPIYRFATGKNTKFSRENRLLAEPKSSRPFSLSNVPNIWRPIIALGGVAGAGELVFLFDRILTGRERTEVYLLERIANDISKVGFLGLVSDVVSDAGDFQFGPGPTITIPRNIYRMLKDLTFGKQPLEVTGRRALDQLPLTRLGRDITTVGLLGDVGWQKHNKLKDWHQSISRRVVGGSEGERLLQLEGFNSPDKMSLWDAAAAGNKAVFDFAVKKARENTKARFPDIRSIIRQNHPNALRSSFIGLPKEKEALAVWDREISAGDTEMALEHWARTRDTLVEWTREAIGTGTPAQTPQPQPASPQQPQQLQRPQRPKRPPAKSLQELRGRL